MYSPLRILMLCLLVGAWPGTLLAGEEETLGAGDSIRITVAQNPNLTTEARISARGSIWFPLLGDVEIGGLSQGEAVTRIADLLKQRQYLNDPIVSLTVLQVRSRQVSVLGLVARPGRYVLDDAGTRLTDVLALAGGIAPEGDNRVTVVSASEGGAVRRQIDVNRIYRNLDPAANIELKSGDTVVVERAPVFYINGEVYRAGAYRLAENLNVMQAVSLAGGVTPRGTERGIRIHRRGANGHLSDIVADMSDSVVADDVINIPERLF